MNKIKTLLVSVALAWHGVTLSSVSVEEAAKLGKELTPIGAEMSGNADGSIPPYTGGISEPPENYDGGRYMVNPFADEEKLFSISAKNQNQYEAYLSNGQRAMFDKYPDTYRLDVYPTHRSAYVPKEIQEKVKFNATNARLVDSGNGVEGYDGYYPFPIPTTAYDVLWNHLLRYRGSSISRVHSQIITQANGNYHEVKLREVVVWPENMKGHDSEDDANIMVYFRQLISEPARLTGNVLLVHDTINQVQQPRNAWIYNAGQRRVRRAPQVAYDGPGTAANGMRTSDNFDMFTGAPDRYDWKLEGKQELYIPYNNYELASEGLRYKDLIQVGHLNPDKLRYEKHRVWKVVATVKEDKRHIYAKRVFYFDEDTWQIVYVDQYDARGQLWRVSEGFTTQYYTSDSPWLTAEAIYDLIAGRYLVMGLTSESDEAVKFGFTAKKKDFTPSAIRRMGIR